MLREITLGQYYPVDSPIHRLDPRTKLFGTLVFILSLFVADNIWGYGLATIVLAAVIRLTKVPFRYMVKGLKAVLFLLLLSVSFNLFLTSGPVLDLYDHQRRAAACRFYGGPPGLSGLRLHDHDLDHHAQCAHGRHGKGPWLSEQGGGAGP